MSNTAKMVCVVLAVAAVAGVGLFYANFDTRIHRGESGELKSITITPHSQIAPAAAAPTATARPTIRIATFHLGPLAEQKLANRQVAEVLVSLLTRFDLVALQDIGDGNRGTLLRLVELLNATGRQYRFATERSALDPCSAFLFDAASIEIDPSTIERVKDPQGRLRHEPLVALFRTRGPSTTEAFTFKLINIFADPDQAASELALLDDVYRAVRDDGSTEDDVILLGDFAATADRLAEAVKALDLSPAIRDAATTLRGTQAVDNMLLHRRATVEAAGRAQVMDLMREFDLPLAAALEVSEHLPVWAEFTVYEGGAPGPVAARPGSTAR